MRCVIFSLLLLSFSSVSLAADWLTLPSSYSHDVSGSRVTQYEPIDLPTAPVAANFRSSGYTHTRSSLNYGASSDNYHRVQKWGDPVRPYGEWRFPYRPYSTPYPNWGAPLAGLNTGFGNPLLGGGFGHRGYGGGYGTRPRPDAPDGEATEKPEPGYEPRFRDHERGLLGGGRWPNDRDRQFPVPQGPLNPYPSGAGTPYPVAPYYDGYYPSYSD